MRPGYSRDRLLNGIDDLNCLVEIPGIEPGVPEGGGFTVHCITIDASSPNLVQMPSILMRGLDGLSRWQRSCSFHVEPAIPSRRYLRLNTNVYLKFWHAP